MGSHLAPWGWLCDGKVKKEMNAKQKECIMPLLRSAEDHRDYSKSYLFPYQDFFDPTDDFTVFLCEELEDKGPYLEQILRLIQEDESAQAFAETYGFEEDGEHTWIYSDTLIIFSKLPLARIERIFNEPEDIFPSQIGEFSDFDENNLVIGEDGIPAVTAPGEGQKIYYCWWD